MFTAKVPKNMDIKAITYLTAGTRMTVFGIVRFKRQTSRAFPRAAVASRQLLGLAELTGQHHDGLDVVIEDLQTWRRAR
jgi:hypothetical protein